MKKLINLIETVAAVDTSKYPNLSFVPLKGSNPAGDSINDVLLQDINTAAKNANLKADITTAVSGHDTKTDSGNLSRHVPGNAVDIAMINGAGITKQLGDALVAELIKLGYQSVNAETSSVPKAILWQVAGHTNHVHVSNTTNTPSVSSETTSSSYDASSTDDEFTNAARQISRGYVEPIVGSMVNQQNENMSIKETRLLKDIEKIKKLL